MVPFIAYWPCIRCWVGLREKKEPGAWTTFNTQSLLGQKKYAEAGPLLTKGYQGMKDQEDKILSQGKVSVRFLARTPSRIKRLSLIHESHVTGENVPSTPPTASPPAIARISFGATERDPVWCAGVGPEIAAGGVDIGA
jgi:hypothetical protein